MGGKLAIDGGVKIGQTERIEGDIEMKIELTAAEQITIRMGLRAWVGRCESEAAAMDKFAIEYREKGELEIADKAERNAIASRQMGAEAEALLESGKV